ILFLILIFSIMYLPENSFSQRIVLQEGFESSGFNADSLPTRWFKLDNDGTNPGFPLAVWSVRDSGSNFPGVNAIIHSRAHTGTRGVSIPWRAGDPIADDWLFTDSMTIQAGDSLIFWMLHGTPEDLALTNYIDTMQVHVCAEQDPLLSIAKLGTIRSLDSNNNWKEVKFDLSAFSGQRIFLAFRFYMNTTVDGLWCNIDDIFVGNRSAVGITQTGTNIPDKFSLNQNYPNPFNPNTKISFDLARSSNVNLTVFNSVGQKVMSLFEGYKPAGSYIATFDGSSLASGTYYYRLETDFFTETKKMQLIK
ncbi:MAG TPA: choice-of-anchor J domain-containing protein, partial [Ignavibacteria bacterium]|nr:choice-of-anchor J domain-containing protein [Ignavibacteria bacterium]